MTTDNLLFLLARLLMGGLCGLAAVLALWRLAAAARAGRSEPVLGLMALVLGIGVAEAIQDGWWNVVQAPTDPIGLTNWLWIGFDLAVPLLALTVVRVMAQRDAALARLAALSVTDPLTGLANRRGFEARAHAAIATCRRQGQPICLLSFDLDRFKRINDGWGHAAGDAVLAGAARAMAGQLRAGDVLGRLGGEEFSALLPATTLAEAAALAERLRQAVRAEVPHPAGGDTLTTVSIGVAPLGPGAPAESLAAALAASDAALYAAKEKGRDRVEVAHAG
ncbi:GGDEF domain-containing protein [Roseomonas stagni]|uniref:diguanylate cyclase n=1 Tax=Falsiroseomonas algicola TaxID=2716930 RepID=A0A6M1LH12_9PROT|nr:GGDEF domain-containing protein [Falsiroseomonas algicola]NGM19214.1 GGDEF domain-containing protein [Falsiroseomonas algicola]